MSEPKDFGASMQGNGPRTPIRVAFVTRRTSPHVKAGSEPHVMAYPEVLLRVAIAAEVLLIVLILVSLFRDAPLEGLADPMRTPNPAKAPWYFLGLQELLHYFPPLVGGVLIPALVIVALIVIPYFGINIEAEGFWIAGRTRKLRIVVFSVAALTAFLAWFRVYAVLIPTVLIAAFMLREANSSASSLTSPVGRFRSWLRQKPLPFWIMTWFLVVAILLTLIGTFFRGPGWAWVWPWSMP